MAQVLVYTDPHLGLKRQANFTPASAAAREKEALSSLHKLLKAEKKKGTYTMCLGDFFDKSTNSEDVILSTVRIAELTDVILSGNHDIPNNVDKSSSLHVIGALFDKKVLFADLKKPDAVMRDIGSTRFVFAPHVLSQDDFEKVLRQANEVESKPYNVLCLHCNYGMPKGLMESSLVLERGEAAELLKTFHQIWIGHEHTAKDDFDGRLKLIGSWRPTAFDNLDDKRVLRYDTETGRCDQEIVWRVRDHAYIGPASGCVDLYKQQYFDLTDDMGTGEAQRQAVRLLKAQAFAVRIRGDREVTPEEEVELMQMDLLPDVIRQDISDHAPNLLPFFQELMQEQTQ